MSTHFFLPVDQTSMEHSYDWVTPFAKISNELNEQPTVSKQLSITKPAGSVPVMWIKSTAPPLFQSHLVRKIWANELMIYLLPVNQRMSASVTVF